MPFVGECNSLAIDGIYGGLNFLYSFLCHLSTLGISTSSVVCSSCARLPIIRYTVSAGLKDPSIVSIFENTVNVSITDDAFTFKFLN